MNQEKLAISYLNITKYFTKVISTTIQTKEFTGKINIILLIPTMLFIILFMNDIINGKFIFHSLFLIIFIIIMFYNLIGKPYINTERIIFLLKEILRINTTLYLEVNTILSIDDILVRINQCYIILDELIHIKNNNTFATIYSNLQDNKAQMRFAFMKILQMQISFCNEILADLRSDLSIRITEQQSTLESAKSEVEKNIHGTTELNQVSELQRARLDKQIKQFEDLQRLLINK